MVFGQMEISNNIREEKTATEANIKGNDKRNKLYIIPN